MSTIETPCEFHYCIKCGKPFIYEIYKPDWLNDEQCDECWEQYTLPLHVDIGGN